MSVKGRSRTLEDARPLTFGHLTAVETAFEHNTDAVTCQVNMTNMLVLYTSDTEQKKCLFGVVFLADR